MFKQIKYKLLFLFLLIGLVPFAITLGLEYLHVTEIIHDRSLNQLKTVREIKKHEIESYFAQIRLEISFFAQNATLINATKEFTEAFNAIKPTDLPPDYPHILKVYYQEEMIPKLRHHKSDSFGLKNLLPIKEKTILLQTQYLTGNKTVYKPLPYHKVHSKYHNLLSDFMKTHGYYDLIIIDDATGHIIYTVDKETDFATSLLDGPYANTNLGNLFRKIRYTGLKGQSVLCDFERYVPSYLAPAAFLAAPIFDGETKIGTLVFQIPIDKIDAITTSKKVWREEGLGETGESYIIGKDCKMRTNSRFIIENPSKFFEQLKQIQFDQTELTLMEFYKTTVLFRTFCSETVLKAITNQSGMLEVEDYRGMKVLSSFTPLAIADVNWVFLAEIDADEVFAPLSKFKRRSIYLTVFIIGLILISTWFTARTIYKPIIELTNQTRELGKGNLQAKVSIESKDELGFLGQSFNESVVALRNKQEEIEAQNATLEEQKERLSEQAVNLSSLNEEIFKINSHLDDLVKLRTSALEKQNKVLTELAFFNSHRLRAPIASLLGLIHLVNTNEKLDDKLQFFELLKKIAEDLDVVIHEIQEKIANAEMVGDLNKRIESQS